MPCCIIVILYTYFHRCKAGYTGALCETRDSQVQQIEEYFRNENPALLEPQVQTAFSGIDIVLLILFLMAIVIGVVAVCVMAVINRRKREKSAYIDELEEDSEESVYRRSSVWRSPYSM